MASLNRPSVKCLGKIPLANNEIMSTVYFQKSRDPAESRGTAYLKMGYLYMLNVDVPVQSSWKKRNTFRYGNPTHLVRRCPYQN